MNRYVFVIYDASVSSLEIPTKGLNDEERRTHDSIAELHVG